MEVSSRNSPDVQHGFAPRAQITGQKLAYDRGLQKFFPAGRNQGRFVLEKAHKTNTADGTGRVCYVRHLAESSTFLRPIRDQPFFESLVSRKRSDPTAGRAAGMSKGCLGFSGLAPNGKECVSVGSTGALNPHCEPFLLS